LAYSPQGAQISESPQKSPSKENRHDAENFPETDSGTDAAGLCRRGQAPRVSPSRTRPVRATATPSAGAAATAEDAGTIYFNPAGMTNLPMGHNVTAVGTILERTIEFKDTGTVTTPGNPAPLLLFPGGTTVFAPTGERRQRRRSGPDPCGLLVIRLLAKTSASALACRRPSATRPITSKNFRGFNSGFYAEMVQMNINPSIAYKVNDMLSIGAGVNFARNEITLKQGMCL
jgi:long-chain fatty acid transport protein